MSRELNIICDCWDQWKIEVEIDDESWDSDGALSTLEDIGLPVRARSAGAASN